MQLMPLLAGFLTSSNSGCHWNICLLINAWTLPQEHAEHQAGVISQQDCFLLHSALSSYSVLLQLRCTSLPAVIYYHFVQCCELHRFTVQVTCRASTTYTINSQLSIEHLSLMLLSDPGRRALLRHKVTWARRLGLDHTLKLNVAVHPGTLGFGQGQVVVLHLEHTSCRLLHGTHPLNSLTWCAPLGW